MVLSGMAGMAGRARIGDRYIVQVVSKHLFTGLDSSPEDRSNLDDVEVVLSEVQMALKQS